MLDPSNKAMQKSSSDLSSKDFIVKLLSADSTVNQLIKSNSHVTSLFLPYANDILFYAFLDRNEINDDSLILKLCSSSTKILESNNMSIKTKILTTDKFKEAIELLQSQTDSNFDDCFVSKFASITENYLTHSPQLIRNEFSFLFSFSKFILTNFSVYLLFRNLLTCSHLNSYLIHNYLQENQFIDFLFSNLSNNSIDLLIHCAQIDIFRSPSFVDHLLNFDLHDSIDEKFINRKWEIIATYVKTTVISIEDENKSALNALSVFLPLVGQAFFHIDPTNYDYYLKSQVSALQFLSAMFYNISLKAQNEICNLSKFLYFLKDIIITFPNHTIAVNEVFMLVEALLLSSSARIETIQEFIPFVHKLLMYQKIQSNQSNENLNDQSEVHFKSSDKNISKPNTLYSFFNQCNLKAQSLFSNDSSDSSSPIKPINEEENEFPIVISDYNNDDNNNYEEEEQERKEEPDGIDKILSPCLRGFAASFINRLMVDEDNDSELENDLNENELFNESTEYLIEVYNPLSESGYGYNKELKSPNRKGLNTSYLDIKAKNLFVLI